MAQSICRPTAQKVGARHVSNGIAYPPRQDTRKLLSMQNPGSNAAQRESGVDVSAQ
jgi:hypothetical protein